MRAVGTVRVLTIALAVGVTTLVVSGCSKPVRHDFWAP